MRMVQWRSRLLSVIVILTVLSLTASEPSRRSKIFNLILARPKKSGGGGGKRDRGFMVSSGNDEERSMKAYHYRNATNEANNTTEAAFPTPMPSLAPSNATLQNATEAAFPTSLPSLAPSNVTLQNSTETLLSTPSPSLTPTRRNVSFKCKKFSKGRKREHKKKVKKAKKDSVGPTLEDASRRVREAETDDDNDLCAPIPFASWEQKKKKRKHKKLKKEKKGSKGMISNPPSFVPTISPVPTIDNTTAFPTTNLTSIDQDTPSLSPSKFLLPTNINDTNFTLSPTKATFTFPPFNITLSPTMSENSTMFPSTEPSLDEPTPDTAAPVVPDPAPSPVPPVIPAPQPTVPTPGGNGGSPGAPDVTSEPSLQPSNVTSEAPSVKVSDAPSVNANEEENEERVRTRDRRKLKKELRTHKPKNGKILGAKSDGVDVINVVDGNGDDISVFQDDYINNYILDLIGGDLNNNSVNVIVNGNNNVNNNVNSNGNGNKNKNKDNKKNGPILKLVAFPSSAPSGMFDDVYFFYNNETTPGSGPVPVSPPAVTPVDGGSVVNVTDDVFGFIDDTGSIDDTVFIDDDVIIINNSSVGTYFPIQIQTQVPITIPIPITHVGKKTAGSSKEKKGGKAGKKGAGGGGGGGGGTVFVPIISNGTTTIVDPSYSGYFPDTSFGGGMYVTSTSSKASKGAKGGKRRRRR